MPGPAAGAEPRTPGPLVDGRESLVDGCESLEGARPLSPLVRAFLIVVGTTALIIGVIGIVVPVLPTTPFLLLAAACYARSSARLYAWLLGQPSLGRIVAEWRRSRALPPGVKPRALLLVAVTFAVSIAIVDVLALRVVLAALGLTVVYVLWRIPAVRAT
jgi:uncharacterized membrane protein YbaN (DUF454 family)